MLTNYNTLFFTTFNYLFLLLVCALDSEMNRNYAHLYAHKNYALTKYARTGE